MNCAVKIYLRSIAVAYWSEIWTCWLQRVSSILKGADDERAFFTFGGGCSFVVFCLTLIYLIFPLTRINATKTIEGKNHANPLILLIMVQKTLRLRSEKNYPPATDCIKVAQIIAP